VLEVVVGCRSEIEGTVADRSRKTRVEF
jgi:hypothetical protein